MSIEQFIEEISREITECEFESTAYESLVEKGTDVFDSAKAASFFDGKVEAFMSVLGRLQQMNVEVSNVLVAQEV